MRDFLKNKAVLKNIFLLPGFLLFLLVGIYIFNFKTLKDLKAKEVLTINFLLPSPAPYPFINKNTNFNLPLNLTAKAAAVIDDDSKVVLFSKNPNFRFSTASTAKIMTALTALDYYKERDILTIKTDDVEEVTVGFKKNERFYFIDLLHALLLPSGNDAALAIAENYKGGEDEFIKEMNKKAKDFNLINTHFGDPAGLTDNESYTTVIDLARLASKAKENAVFSKIVSTKQKTITDVDNKKSYNLKNLNKLLGISGVDGIKTGFTDEAGGVLVTSKKEGNKTILIVVMKSEDRFADTSKILNFISGKITFQSIHP